MYVCMYTRLTDTYNHLWSRAGYIYSALIGTMYIFGDWLVNIHFHIRIL